MQTNDDEAPNAISDAALMHLDIAARARCLFENLMTSYLLFTNRHLPAVRRGIIRDCKCRSRVVVVDDKRVYHATLILRASVFRVSMQIAAELILVSRKWTSSRTGNKMISSVRERPVRSLDGSRVGCSRLSANQIFTGADSHVITRFFLFSLSLSLSLSLFLFLLGNYLYAAWLDLSIMDLKVTQGRGAFL